jgi:pyridoxine 4-dehydrogenase
MKRTLILNASAAGTFKLGDLTINRLGFGAMRLTGPGIWADSQNPREARDVLRKAIELGVNFIDTADSYGPEVSENIIAETLYPYYSDVMLPIPGTSSLKHLEENIGAASVELSDQEYEQLDQGKLKS